jgi:hypothetical protein
VRRLENWGAEIVDVLSTKAGRILLIVLTYLWLRVQG